MSDDKKVTPLGSGGGGAPACGTTTPCPHAKPCVCTPGRKYANAKFSQTKLIGVRAKIKTRYGKVCCEPNGDSNAYHVVYVNISGKVSGNLAWAQVGYGRERNAGSKSISTYRYAEMKGKHYVVNYDTGHAPSEGSRHKYQCDLDKTTGKWTFQYDGAKWETFSDDGWKNNLGDFIQWTGEIYNKEDDMPGTATNKCEFTQCQYQKDGGAYQDAGITKAHLMKRIESEVEHVSGTAFNIWDKNPRK